MTCFVCKGNIEERTTTFMADLETCLVVIRNVPSLVCTQCGEVSYTDEVSKKIEQIALSLKNKITDIAVTDYMDRRVTQGSATASL